MELETERLILREWRTTDLEPFARLNSDPEVMEHFVRPLTRDESDAFAERAGAHWKTHGFGLWAVEIPGVTQFAGYVGLWTPTFQAAFMPAVEIGWRLDRPHWGHGYATEGARAALEDGFQRVGLREIVSFTSPHNVRSTRVMERLGMTHDAADDFDHPNVPEGHRLRRHVLYRIAEP